MWWFYFIFADRCKEVITIDTRQEWIDKVNRHKGIDNVTFHCIPGDDIQAPVNANELVLDLYKDRHFNVIVLDWGLQRDFFRPHIVQFLANRFAVILDNYSGDALFPSYFDKDFWEGLPLDAYCQTYNDGHWYGQGTRIYSSEYLAD